VERRLQKTSTELFATFLREKSRKTYLFTFFLAQKKVTKKGAKLAMRFTSTVYSM
jgi:hypothetical protein